MREKRACKACEEQGVECAPVPVRIIEKGLASDRVVIDTVVSKYADHLPLYRQSAILEREAGIELSRATLDGWVMRVGELLRPISAAMGQELLSGSYIQADETTDKSILFSTPPGWHSQLASNSEPEIKLLLTICRGMPCPPNTIPLIFPERIAIKCRDPSQERRTKSAVVELALLAYSKEADAKATGSNSATSPSVPD